MEKQKVLVLGGGDIGVGKAVAALLKQLDKVMVVDRPSNVFEIKMDRPVSHYEPILTNYTPDRDYGWYRKFEKNGKKRNFKKAN